MIDELSIVANRPVLVIATGLSAYAEPFESQQPTSIGPATEISVRRELARIPEAHSSLCVCVIGFGGRSTSALNIAYAIRSRFSSVTTYVPHVAASASGFLSLLGDEVVLSRGGFLTKMDPVLSLGQGQLPASTIIAATESGELACRPEVVLMARTRLDAVSVELAQMLATNNPGPTVEAAVQRLIRGPGDHDAPIRREELRRLRLPIASDVDSDADRFLSKCGDLLDLLCRHSVPDVVRASNAFHSRLSFLDVARWR